MRSLLLALTVMVSVQGGVPKSDSARAPVVLLDTLRARLARRCVPTAPMPIAVFRGRPPESMPVARPDSVRDSAMVIRLMPCYLLDSIVPRERRPR
jgi:hypothetical protein